MQVKRPRWQPSRFSVVCKTQDLKQDIDTDWPGTYWMLDIQPKNRQVGIIKTYMHVVHDKKVQFKICVLFI